jgi:hypothetical protein
LNGYDGGIAKTDQQVAQLLMERPAGWEYLLYAGALCAGVEKLETKYSDYSLGYAPRLGVMIGSGEFVYFIQSQLSEVEVMIGTLNTLFGDKLIPSEDPDRILHDASRVVRLYGDMLLWAERLRGMAMPGKYRTITEALVQFSTQPINELRNLAHDLATQVDELPSRIARDEDVNITVTVRFIIPHELAQTFSAKLATLKA